ncbi:hypothetical protein R69658_07278 [Paraburkholderia aspalathi]|uniref:Prolyl 4-hydroxylase alpha subunit Fe(2+) 2OG dioxygenase domain-containing protein n=1 Tax=Paraburkholderia aspalathi TaxID=1324617 RepID=A0ABN7NBI3_9BURK|nr:2OG-Fe(II) oxygenase [Paraburkholderia aspalathi]MBK3823604.1 2OG-Fe(II) oxygenase [Paraburkholderia aspalathi]MBK3835439.1 2OG-Fe(II) oxygenase [Paraburkholderia aspalathi]MBK3865199.1 2OG-Fe(II) oxygenase [Paraburkholderia aspalathi]CAE6853507.1 hypothetical protein R69658_07278 [Paraburkholderia aspalathi]
MRGWSWPEELTTLRKRFLTAEPYPHLVLDGVFAAEALIEVFLEVPIAASSLWTTWGSGWQESNGDRNQKRGISSLYLLGERTSKFLQQLNSKDFLADVRQLTDEPALAADATFNGGGLHCTGRGGRLRIHVDMVRHPRPDRFDQAVNLIVFINPIWLPEYRGQLELWSRNASHRCVSIEPLFNRLVLFRSDRETYHGHPEALQCPEGVFRTSIATYYYVPRILDKPPKTLNEIGWSD